MGVFGTTEGISHVHGFAQSAHDYVLYNAQHRSRPFLLGYCSTVHKLDHAVSSQGRHYQGRHEFLDFRPSPMQRGTYCANMDRLSWRLDDLHPWFRYDSKAPQRITPPPPRKPSTIMSGIGSLSRGIGLHAR